MMPMPADPIRWSWLSIVVIPAEQPGPAAPVRSVEISPPAEKEFRDVLMFIHGCLMKSYCAVSGLGIDDGAFGQQQLYRSLTAVSSRYVQGRTANGVLGIDLRSAGKENIGGNVAAFVGPGRSEV